MKVDRQERAAKGTRFSIARNGPKVHELYERLGFERHGVEFRMNFAE
jgi:hypothetical protein